VNAGDLWARIDAQAGHALAHGALHRIDTEARVIEEAGVGFVVRCATQLRKKEMPGAKSAGDPFANPEPDLFIADLTPTHYALLNKYNVLERHLLVITRADIDQDAPLDGADFEALAVAMDSAPTLGFYNGGATAGASQRHKHLQVVRLPISPSRAIPIEALVEADALGRLAFRHAYARVNDDGVPAQRAKAMLSCYDALRAKLQLGSGPYNLLVARDWMLLVPRMRATFGTIAVNSLAFAGALFVRDDEELELLERIGPLAVLRGVAFPKDPS
jgi:ATP adenylyltransferase